MSKSQSSSLFSTILCALLVAGNLVVANLLLDKVDFRRDLTADKRYEIGVGTNTVLDKLNDTVLVRCFFSSNIPKRLRHCERTTLEKLQEYEDAAGGKFVYEFVDPEEGSDAKQEADDLGLVPMRTTEFESATSTKTVICYMAMVFRFGDRKVILNLPQDMAASLEDRARFLADLEYHLTRNIIAVTTRRRTVGVLAEFGPEPNRRGQRPNQGPGKYQGLQNLKALLGRSYDVLPFDTKEVNRGADLPPGLDVLIVHAPKEMTPLGAYIIDQFVMRGGRALFLVDAGKIAVQPKPKRRRIGRQVVNDFDLPTWKGEIVEHGLDELLENWGVRIERSFVEDRSASRYLFIHDRELARNPFGQIVVRPEMRDDEMYSWVIAPARDEDGKLTDEGQIGEGQALVTERDTVLFTSAAPLTLIEDRIASYGGEGEVILRSSTASWTTPIQDGTFSPDPRHRVEGVSTGEASNLVVALTGRFPSYWKGKDIPAAESTEGQPLPVPEERKKAHRDETVDKSRVVIIGDADVLHDQTLQTIVAIEQRVSKVRNDAVVKKKAMGILQLVSNAVDLLAYENDATTLFDVKSRRAIATREIREVKEKDEDRDFVTLLLFGIVPGSIIGFGLLRWLFRRMFAIAS